MTVRRPTIIETNLVACQRCHQGWWLGFTFVTATLHAMTITSVQPRDLQSYIPGIAKPLNARSMEEGI